MIDMHCHLDLYNNPVTLIPEIKKRCRYVLAVTTSPRAWQKAKQVFSGIDCIQVALGLHPEILAAKANEIDLLLANIRNCAVIGEVGIDGSAQYKSLLEMQRSFFREIVIESELQGGKPISIHSRNATKLVLDVVEQNSRKNVPILHWFSGTAKQIEEANALGCWFSVNPTMISNRKGRELVAKMPISRILPETDAPFTEKNGTPYMPWEAFEIAEMLKDIFQIKAEEVNAQLLENFRILSSYL